jgi:hypothetical protein
MLEVEKIKLYPQVKNRLQKEGMINYFKWLKCGLKLSLIILFLQISYLNTYMIALKIN